MKRILAAIILIAWTLVVGSPASAQTSTPTPGPICGAGYYEQNASCVIYSAGWSNTSNAVYSGGSLTSTTTLGANLTFRMYGTTLVIYRTTGTTGTTANFCVDASCQSISFNSGTTVNMAPLVFDVNCLSVCNISITHNGVGGSGNNLDAFAVFANAPTNTPVTPQATWTNQVITQIPPLTEIPQFTQIAPYTQIPPLTQIPLPETWTPFPTPAEQFTQLPYPTPLATWTEQPYGGYTQIPPLTQIPYPTPLDTWTPQPVAMVVITVDGSFAIDWNMLLTIFPTLITQVPPTMTPTETMTPSITPTPSTTPTPTPPGYIQYEMPNAEGTPTMTGVLYIEMTAGDLANNVLLFVIAIIGAGGFIFSLTKRTPRNDP